MKNLILGFALFWGHQAQAHLGHGLFFPAPKTIPRSMARAPAQANVDILSGSRPASQWYRGNTHAHTVLCGHADTSPDEVAKWYLDHGYNFLILSEHNRFIDPKDVKLPADHRKDFILVPGVEITGPKHIHATGMNIRSVPRTKFQTPIKGELIDRYLEQVQSLGGEMVLNHPNYEWAVDVEDMHYVEELRLFELYNGHPGVRNAGDADHISTEAMWTILLDRGKKIYGVSSDDAHHFKTRGKDDSNPGRGWVMVNAKELTADALTLAMARGDFYSTSGVGLAELRVANDCLEIEADEAATLANIAKGWVTGAKPSEDAPKGFSIQFITDGGKVREKVEGPKGSLALSKEALYLRAKITYVHQLANGERRAYYAWTNPVFSR